MSSVIISGDTSGAITLAAPSVAGTNTLTLPSGASGTIAAQGVSSNIVSGTAQNSTSGTVIDFTSIPSWVKRITVNFNNVSTNGSSGVIVQLGTGGTPTTTGYSGMVGVISTTSNTTRGSIYTNGFGLIHSGSPSDQFCGAYIFSLLSGNIWTATGSTYDNTQATMGIVSGLIALAGTLNIVRIASNNGTDTFDAGSINILYE